MAHTLRAVGGRVCWGRWEGAYAAEGRHDSAGDDRMLGDEARM